LFTKKSDFWGIRKLKNLKVLVCVALFSAISIVLGKFLAISIGDAFRISFENLTIMLTGMMFGPLVGAFSGICADILGCILRGYTIIPILTVGAALIGFVSGLFYNILKNTSDICRVSISTFISHALGSVIVKTIGLTLYYEMPFTETLILRSLNYLIVFLAETFVLILLVKNKAFIAQIERIKR
jgi:ECF transporter S component (folate family)